MKVRFITPEGSKFACKFHKAKIVKRKGSWQYKVGFLKPRYFQYISNMHSDIMNDNVCEFKFSDGLKIDCPPEILQWNKVMKSWAVEEHIGKSWWQEYKSLVLTGVCAVMLLGGMFLVGRQFDSISLGFQESLNSLDKIISGVRFIGSY